MNPTLQRYQEANEALESTLGSVTADGWSSPSPCEGWSARDVVGHMIQTQRDFLIGQGHDPGAAPGDDVDPPSAWRTHATRVVEILHDDAVVTAEYDGFFGPTTVGATLEDFYIWDMLVHRWDVATAAGLDAVLTAGELDRIEQGAESFGEGLYMDGVCKPGLPAPSAARQDRLLARLGRRS